VRVGPTREGNRVGSRVERGGEATRYLVATEKTTVPVMRRRTTDPEDESSARTTPARSSPCIGMRPVREEW
jgi:hypothetical protein